MILSIISSNVLLKKQKNGNPYYILFDDKKNQDLLDFKSCFSLEDMSMNTISDYYYYLVLNGDKIDNINAIFTPGVTIDFLNYIYDKENKYNLDLICKYIGEFRENINCNDILENSFLVDIFNDTIFSNADKTAMDFLLKEFFKRNNIKIIQ